MHVIKLLIHVVVCAHFSELIETLTKNGMSAGSNENVRHRSTNGEAAKKSADYTSEQLEAVKK